MCVQFRESVSAAIDDELGADDQYRLDAHLDNCAACRHFSESAWSLHRSMQVGTAPASVPSPRRPIDLPTTPMLELLRWILFTIGGTLAILNTVDLVPGGEQIDAHLRRHGAVFGTALGVGMVIVALRPHRAIGLVPLTSVIGGLMIAAAMADLATDRTSILAEGVHVIELAGLVCLWVLSGGPTRVQRRTAQLGRLRRRSGELSVAGR